MPKLGEGHPIFAAVWSRLHRRINPLRGAVVGPAAGRVLEVGAGGGANLPYYRSADQVVLTEPDPYMLRRAAEALRSSGRPAELVPAAAEELPFPDGSFDTVVSTLVFCSVEDPAAALAEVRRVLKPGGRFRFLEHVRSAHPFWGRVQDWIAPAHRCLTGGCRPNRDTLGAIRRSGFEMEELEQPWPGFAIYSGTARSR